MAIQGPFVVFDRAKMYFADGTGLLLPASAFKAVLATSSQAIDHTFVGASADCRYADLTAELATANGYTAAGLTLSGVAISRSSAPVVEWTTANAVWTLTNTITFKYFLIYNNTVANKNLIGYCDMDTTPGSISPIAGTLTIQPNGSGWFTYT